MGFYQTSIQSLNNLSVVFLLVVFAMGCSKKEEVILPPVKVNMVKAIQKDVPIYEEFVAQVFGESDVDINNYLYNSPCSFFKTSIGILTTFLS